MSGSVLGAVVALAVSSLALTATPPAPSHAGTWGIRAEDVRAAEVRAATAIIDVLQNPLEVAASRFARAFAAGSAEGLAELMSPDGIRLQTEGPGGGGLSPRQAVASLVELVRRYEGGSVAVSRAEPLDGSADRGFAEVRWSTRAAGTSDVLVLTLFLGLAREGDEWHVDEVRLLR